MKNLPDLVVQFYDEIERDTLFIFSDYQYKMLITNYWNECLIFVNDLDYKVAFMDTVTEKVFIGREAKEMISKYITLPEKFYEDEDDED